MTRRDGYVKAAPQTGPRFNYAMTDAVYHADPIEGGSLSSTFARLLTNHVPAKALEIRRNRKPTKAMSLGKAAHTKALGAGPELIVWEHDGRTKDGKAERAARAFDLESEAAVAVTEDEREHIEGMAKALRADPVVSRLLDECLPEVSAFWQEGEFDEKRCQGCLCVSQHDGDYGAAGHTGACPPHTCRVWCRARYDMLGALEAHDYKTTTDVSLRGFSRHMANYGYHQQADFYLRGLRALDHPAADKPLRFICQETTAPYLIQIHTPDEMAMEVARVLNDRAIGIYAACMEMDDWPGYADLEAEPASLPAYYWFDVEDALPDEMRLAREEIVI